MNAGEQELNARLICGQVECLIDGLLCELETVCEDYPEDDDDRERK